MSLEGLNFCNWVGFGGIRTLDHLRGLATIGASKKLNGSAMKLYNYFRSSASFRVRIALALKGLTYDYIPVHLARGDHQLPVFTEISAEGLLPMLETESFRLSQSMAIIEYLDETSPSPPLLPTEALGRARVRALAQLVACEIHPLNNLRVLKYLVKQLKVDEDAKNTWYRYWVRLGLENFERQLQSLARDRLAEGLIASQFCYGAHPTLADCCLVPQIFNGKRFDVNLDGLPLTLAAFEACMKLDAFQSAQPDRCPDYETK